MTSCAAGPFVLRQLAPADHAARAQGAFSRTPDAAPDPIKVLREAHHRAARLLAGGASDAYAAALLGWSPSRVRELRRSPAFIELIALYVERADEIVLDIGARMELVALDAMHELHSRLLDPAKAAEVGEGMLLEVARTFLDRTGYGAVSRSVSTHLVASGDADRLREIAGVAERVVVAEDVRAALSAPAIAVSEASSGIARPPSEASSCIAVVVPAVVVPDD